MVKLTLKRITMTMTLNSCSVLAVDVLDRHVDENGVLKTTRLVLKKGKVPKWFPENVSSIIEAHINTLL
jgi:hypothetical protein